jgi:NUMOD4 motif/HNH endonuclease
MIEEWKSVLGFEGVYAVSSLGRVKSLCRIVVRANGKPYSVSERIMSCTIKSNGYLYVSLRKTGEKQVVKRHIHQLVAMAFLPAKANNLEQVNHLDGNKLNNTPTNLEWCTHTQNMAHAWDNSLVPWSRKSRCSR